MAPKIFQFLQGNGRYRPTALAPLAFSIISFSLILVLVLAGQKPGMMNDYYLVAMEMSSNEASSVAPTATTKATASKRSFPSIALPSISLPPVSLPSVSLPSVSLPPLSAIESSLAAPLEAAGDLVGDILGNATKDVEAGLKSIGTALPNLEQLIISEFENALGIKNNYNFYIANVCAGGAGVLPNGTNSTSNAVMSSCPSYADPGAAITNLSTKIPTTLTVGEASVPIPFASQISSAVGTTGSLLTALGNSLFALFIVVLVFSGLQILSSLGGFFFRSSRLIIFVSLALSALSFFGHVGVAVVITLATVAASSGMKILGEPLGIHVQGGTRALVLVWVGVFFALLNSVYWLVVGGVHIVKRIRRLTKKRNKAEEPKSEFEI
ncbi:uncharacterized protein PAC_09339 [Phialocephala subalpina]|uniref:Uncharacterized protein n=1 Tax=Phialocephala subalpina TaxID=576137 RepID=A0A1L7X379_9HELO|nr:uncharacterized protein PAC_09339 [Phialocephala subalpina]